MQAVFEKYLTRRGVTRWGRRRWDRGSVDAVLGRLIGEGRHVVAAEEEVPRRVAWSGGHVGGVPVELVLRVRSHQAGVGHGGLQLGVKLQPRIHERGVEHRFQFRKSNHLTVNLRALGSSTASTRVETQTLRFSACRSTSKPARQISHESTTSAHHHQPYEATLIPSITKDHCNAMPASIPLKILVRKVLQFTTATINQLIRPALMKYTQYSAQPTMATNNALSNIYTAQQKSCSRSNRVVEHLSTLRPPFTILIRKFPRQ